MATPNDHARGLSAGQMGTGARQTRAEVAAVRLAAIAEAATSGERLGSKEEIRRRCGVSVGTFNEAIRLLQARGLVTVRPGPGGGLFASEQSPMVRLGNTVLALDAERPSVASAIRIRDALDPLLIDDALWHASPADVAELRERIAKMSVAAEAGDAVAFMRANWALHVRIAALSPDVMLRSLYVGLIELIESHMLSVEPANDHSLPEYMAYRHRLHSDLVEAIAANDRARALELIGLHNTTDTVLTHKADAISAG